VLALLALLLLPGLLVVRAPWTAVPLLSLTFWIASWWWLPAMGRTRLLGAFLVAFGLAALLRLARLDASRPSWPALLALTAALLRACAGLAAGSGLALDPTAAQLMVWHDGLPATYVPLREGGSFGAHPHGLDAIAADVALLAGLPVSRALALAAGAARGLWAIGLYMFLSRLLMPGAAGIGTLGASAVVSLLEVVDRGGDASSFLAVGFALAAAGLLSTGRSRAAAVAAGAFAGAAAMTGPAVVTALLALAVVGAAASRRGRFLLAAAAALVNAAPFLVRVGLSLARR
jgi:hypothetical protein